MYSMVLMLAMTPTPDAVACSGKLLGGHSCHGAVVAKSNCDGGGRFFGRSHGCHGAPAACAPAPTCAPACAPAPVECAPAPVACAPAPVACAPAPVACAPVSCAPAPVACAPACGTPVVRHSCNGGCNGGGLFHRDRGNSCHGGGMLSKLFSGRGHSCGGGCSGAPAATCCK